MPQKSKCTPNTVRVYCFEGLGSYYFGFLSKALEARGIKVEKYGWTEKPKIEDGSIICGHSYGGFRAIERANQSKPLALFTIDPRKPLSISPDFKVECEAYNYYQTGFVRGYSVDGAKVNQIVKGLSHIRMPNNAAFILDFSKVWGLTGRS